jgi:nucleotide-binding universal stress UspA family protein
MYRTILVTLDGSAGDEVILEHVRGLARLTDATLILFHVADGWEARFLGSEAESEEVREDTKYLERLAETLRNEGFTVDPLLGFGDPGREIVRLAKERDCDLIAMSTHGHRFISDLLYGSPADFVRHRVTIPVLLLKVP